MCDMVYVCCFTAFAGFGMVLYEEVRELKYKVLGLQYQMAERNKHQGVDHTVQETESVYNTDAKAEPEQVIEKESSIENESKKEQ